MKTLVVVLLLASLAANAFWWTRPAGAPAPVSAAIVPQIEAHPSAKGTTIAQSDSPAGKSNAMAVPFSWTDLPTGDLEALIATLRERGVPQHIIRGIAIYYLGEEYREKRKALTTQMSRFRYWENGSNAEPEETARRAQLRNLAREQSARIDALVGTVEPAYDGQYLSYIRKRYGNLPTTKVMELQAIEQDYSELQSQVRQASQGLMLAEDREALALLDQEKSKDLKAVLTPAEYEEFEFRSSNTGNILWRNLDVMQPTEQEFRTIFRLQRPFDEKYLNSSAARSRAPLPERQAAERELIAAVKEALGPERGTEYERSRDSSYVHAHSVAKELGLPKESGERLWSVQKNAVQQFNDVARHESVAPTERSQRQLEVLNAAKAAIIAEIGEENLSTYQQGGGGWLRAFEQMATRLPPQPPPRPVAP